MTYRIVDQTADGLSVEFPSGEVRSFSWRWLADHDQSAAGVDPKTRQRLVDTFALPSDLGAGVASIEGPNLVISWLPAHELGVNGESIVAVETLEDQPSYSSLPTWDAATAPEPSVGFKEVTTSDQAVADWLNLIAQHGFCVVRDVPEPMDATEQLINRIAPPLVTVFGTMWQVESGSDAHADSAYSSEALEPHTDGTYVENAPAFQLLHFTQSAESGGASVLVDGFAVAEQLRRSEPEAFRILSTTSVPAHYIEDGAELRAERQPIRLDRHGNLRQVSFNNYDRSSMWLPPGEMDAFYSAYEAFHRLIVDQSNRHELLVQAGQALVFDNWRVLHGRSAFTGSRRFQGAYLGRDEVDSRRRTLTAAT